MKVHILLIAAAALAAGCTTSKQITGPDGRTAHSISCNGAANSIGGCFEKAGDICGASGYEVLDKDGSVVPISTLNGSWNASGGRVNGFGGGMVNRSLLVRCKG